MKRLGLLVWIVLSIVSCREPSKSFQMYLTSDEALNDKGRGVYSYELDFDDSLARYDIFFYCRSRVGRHESLPLSVQWVNPAGETSEETVYLKVVNPRGTKELYRSDTTPKTKGLYTLNIYPMDLSAELEGFGVIFQRKDGTR